MILVTKTSDQTRVCVCVCVLIKLHIATQSGPIILAFYATRIDPPKGGSMILITDTSDQTRQKGVCARVCLCLCLCIFIELNITVQSGPLILVILCHSH